ncbi:helix-turn-helix domain-containing protein [Erythrobacter sp. W53]|uniref:helix-turn-helix domain-containing protein n=1 Tax=Erythrobacter sp. W53 TaxID=3425947 RepID=UPI003D767361
MSIADVASLTKISTRYLIAIEQEDFARLPSRVHCIGFVSAFAKAVRADANSLTEDLKCKLDHLELPCASRKPAGIPPKEAISPFSRFVRKTVATLNA